MNKSELVAAVAEKSGVSRSDAEQVLSVLTAVIVDAASGNDKVALPGFGTFAVTERAARQGRNPATGETMSIPASRSLSFKQASAVKQALNG